MTALRKLYAAANAAARTRDRLVRDLAKAEADYALAHAACLRHAAYGKSRKDATGPDYSGEVWDCSGVASNTADLVRAMTPVAVKRV